MFTFFKRKYPASPPDFSAVKTDMHSHLLPGIDDGSPDTETSLLLINGLTDLGYRQFITTPHIMWDLYKNTPLTIGDTLKKLRKTEKIPAMRAAAEYFIDDYFDALMDKDEPLLTISGKQVLVEFSFVAAPMDLKDQLFKLQIKGYEPILAHPERYTYLAGNKILFDDLKSMGCLFQLNLLSLSGYYGKVSQDLAHYLISKNYIDLVGTDLHHQRHLDALRSSKNILNAVQQLLDSGKLQNPALSF